jgi:hypothetical protein
MLTKVTYAALDFWNLEVDLAHDFKYYFKEYNPSRLIQFKTHPQKKKARDMIFGVYAYKQPARGGTTIATNNTTTSEYKDTLDYKILESLF